MITLLEVTQFYLSHDSARNLQCMCFFKGRKFENTFVDYFFLYVVAVVCVFFFFLISIFFCFVSLKQS